MKPAPLKDKLLDMFHKPTKSVPCWIAYEDVSAAVAWLTDKVGQIGTYEKRLVREWIDEAFPDVSVPEKVVQNEVKDD